MKTAPHLAGLLAVFGFMSLLFALPWPSYAQIKPDESVAFYGPYLYRNADGKLVLVLEGRIYEKVRSSVRRKAIEQGVFRYIGKTRDDFDASSLQLLSDRVLRFLEDGESGKSLKIRVRGQAGEAVVGLAETDASGYFSGTLTGSPVLLGDLVGTGNSLELEAVLSGDDTRQFKVSLPVPRRLPLLVVSDVDDTIRIAEVTDRSRLVERTFLRPYEAVPGMARLYGELAARGAWFHFVSASPWQLGAVIEQFMADAKFPAGVLHCRQISWNFWENDPLDTRKYKIAEIETLLARFSESKLLLIGDSGEHDPDVYTEICRAHRDRVAGIWIRRVKGDWNPARLAEVTQMLGREHVVAFETVEALGPFAKTIADQIGTR